MLEQADISVQLNQEFAGGIRILRKASWNFAKAECKTIEQHIETADKRTFLARGVPRLNSNKL